MQVTAPIAVVLAMAVTGLIFYIAAGNAREIVKRNAPEYAQRLFTRGLESFFARSPVRFSVLFGEVIPPEVKEWV